MSSEDPEVAAPSTSKGRGGRPPANMAGQVDVRLLDAAKELFLSRGYEATSCDQIASLANAGKASLYARYANKQALFMAVVSRNIDSTLEWEIDVRRAETALERLQNAGEAILEHSLRPDVIAMMRMLIETAPRLPALAEETHRLGREAGIAQVVKAVVAPDNLDERVTFNVRLCAEALIDYAFAQQQMSALFGTNREELRSAAGAKVGRVVGMLRAAGYCDALD